MTSVNVVPDELITWYLHITRRDAFVPAYVTDADLCIITMRTPDIRYYKFLYTAVGEQLRWRDRLIMAESELLAALSNPLCSVHVLFADGVPAGYYELVQAPPQQGVISTELAYFGLRPEYQGRGWGKHLLSCAVQQAFDRGCQRLWVHTCNLDAPSALPNYQKRGFVIYDTVTIPMPDRYK